MDGREAKKPRRSASDVVLFEDDDDDDDDAAPPPWSCDACTFDNANAAAIRCEMCGTLRRTAAQEVNSSTTVSSISSCS